MKPKTLVTGAGGFIGSHMVEALIEAGHEVRAFLRYNSRSDWGYLEGSPQSAKIDIFGGDIRDYDSVLSAMEGCQNIIHLAALIGIPYSYVSPRAYIETNVTGTYNVLQAARSTGVERLLITSTSETYGSAQYVPMDEEHPVSAQSPYAASKIAADHLALSFHKSFGLPVRIVRPFNTYGPRQSARAVIPTITMQIISGKKEIEVGNIHALRDYTFVKDTVSGFLKIMSEDVFIGRVANVGSGEELSIEAIIHEIQRQLGTNVPIKIMNERLRPEASEVNRLMCDNSFLTTHTDWSRTYDFKRGIAETLDWIKRNIGLYKRGIYAI